MLPEIMIETIRKIEDETDYRRVKNSITLSGATDEMKEEALKELRIKKPQYEKVDKRPTEKVEQDIKNGESDISDIGN